MADKPNEERVRLRMKERMRVVGCTKRDKEIQSLTRKKRLEMFFSNLCTINDGARRIRILLVTTPRDLPETKFKIILTLFGAVDVNFQI